MCTCAGVGGGTQDVEGGVQEASLIIASKGIMLNLTSFIIELLSEK